MSNPPGLDHKIDFTTGQDYRIVPSDPSGDAAYTAMSPPWSWSGLTPTVSVAVDRSKSWVLASQVMNAYLRSHEQGHFDITALIARDFFNQWPASANNAAELEQLQYILSPRLMALDNGNAGAYEISTDLDDFTANQALWNVKLSNLMLSNGTSEDLKNWVNGTVLKNPAGHRINLPQIP
jgi:hypothetical protein